MPRTVGRPSKPAKERSKNAGFSLYPKEISAVKQVSAKRKFKTVSDCLRSLLIADDDPLVRGKIEEPKRV